MAPKGVLDDLGAEITAIISPVTICMFLVVLLVRGLTPNGYASQGPSLGTLVYQEKSTDSSIQKFEGAFLNALVFIVAIAAVTFLLFVMFYFRCTRFIWGYMGFSGFVILGFLGGTVAVQTIQTYLIPLDIISFGLFLYNFSVVGVLAVFFCKMPIFLTQSYLVIIGAIVAFWFTHLPEWTTWLLLAAMSIYDLAAVLSPGGPLKLLVELAIERNEEIPALVYEGRPTSLSRPSSSTNVGDSDSAVNVAPRRQSRRRFRGRWQRRGDPVRVTEETAPDDLSIVVDESSSLLQGETSSGTRKVLQTPQIHVEEETVANPPRNSLNSEIAALHTAQGSQASPVAVSDAFQRSMDEFFSEIPLQDADEFEKRSVESNNQSDEEDHHHSSEDDENKPFFRSAVSSSTSLSCLKHSDDISLERNSETVLVNVSDTLLKAAAFSEMVRGEEQRKYNDMDDENIHDDGETNARGGVHHRHHYHHQLQQEHQEQQEEQEQEQQHQEEEASEFGLPDAIKLGLGDFIFYSVLVGRAAMYDLMTVYSCYLAIVAGLGATLILLAVYKKALPALPISITLGIVFYLLTRMLMDPFVSNLTTNLVFL